jgi:LPS export ABC transporter protein LptC
MNRIVISTKAKRTALGALFVILMAEILIIAPREIGVSSRSDSPLLSQSETSDPSGQVMRGIHMVETKGEKRDWELRSDHAYTEESGGRWKLENVNIRFFGEGDIYYDVTGKTGEVNVQTKDVEIQGDVKMVSSNGYTFRSQKLNYLSDGRQIYTKDPIEVRGGQERGEHPSELVGTGAIANLITNEIAIQSDVRSKKQTENGDWIYIESKRAELSAANKFAKYLGEVTIDYKGSRITGPSARFDYDQKAKAVSSMLVEGGGRVTDLSKWATANSIQMLFPQNKFILKGGPRVVQDNDELVGEEIVFLDGGKEIVVNRAKAEFTPRRSD